MTNQHDLAKKLIPLGEYRKPQFLFYDCKMSQLYAIDGYNRPGQSVWIWLGIVLVAPILRLLSHTILIQSSFWKMVSVLVAVLVAVGISKFFRKLSFENKRLYPVDIWSYQNEDFYAFAHRANKRVLEGLVFVSVAAVVSLGLYLWGGDILFLLCFSLMTSSVLAMIDLNHLKRGQAIRKLKEAP